MWLTGWEIAFVSTMFFALWATGDDPRNMLAAWVIVTQTIFVYASNSVTGHQPLFAAVIYMMAVIAFVVFSTRKTGKALALLSAFIGIIHIFGFWGLISTELNQGFAHTVWNYGTILCYVQLCILLYMGKDKVRALWSSLKA